MVRLAIYPPWSQVPGVVHTTICSRELVRFGSRFARCAAAFGLLLALPCCSALGANEASVAAKTSNPLRPIKWEGIYQGPYHIYLRIVTEGNRATGDWRAVGERQGEFTGSISGNELDLAWTERGADSSAWSGRGYFVYEPSKRAGVDEIHGEWGVGQMASGNSWWALRRGDIASYVPASILVDSDSGSGDDPRGDTKNCGGVGCDEGEVDPE